MTCALMLETSFVFAGEHRIATTREPSARRGRGYAGAVTAAWARAIRASGRTPAYGTSWTNHASLAVARKLGRITHASSWSVGRA